MNAVKRGGARKGAGRKTHGPLQGVSFRLTEAEYHLVAEAAEAEGVTVGTFARNAAREAAADVVADIELEQEIESA